MSEFGPMGRLAEAIGFDAAVKLVTAFGGTRPYIRKTTRMKRPDPVREVIGDDAHDRLIQAGYCGQIDVPQCRAWLIARRDEEILLRIDSGEPMQDIALSHRLTIGHVQRIRKSKGAPCSEK